MLCRGIIAVYLHIGFVCYVAGCKGKKNFVAPSYPKGKVAEVFYFPPGKTEWKETKKEIFPAKRNSP